MMEPWEAFKYLEGRYQGGYEQMILDTLDVGGVVVQSARFLLVFSVHDNTAHVAFACGDMRALLTFAHANAGLFGYNAVQWTRAICGKHSATHRYTLEQLKR